MGSYCSLSINGFEVDSCKSYFNPFWAQFFRESDRRIRRVHYSSYYTQPIEDSSELVNSYEYATSVKIVKERFELLGYSLVKSMDAYDDLAQQAVDNWSGINENCWSAVHCKVLKMLGFSGWITLLKGLIQSSPSR